MSAALIANKVFAKKIAVNNVVANDMYAQDSIVKQTKISEMGSAPDALRTEG